MVARRIPWRGVVIGALLIPLITYWNNAGYMVTTSRPDTVSLFYNVVFFVLVLTLFNHGVRRVRPGAALSHGELLIVYSMLSVASSLNGLDFIAPMILVVAHPIWFASDANDWDKLFLRHIPSYLIPTDYDTLRGYVQGHGSIFDDGAYRAWLVPFVVWGAFVVVLSFGMLCLNTIVRKDWVERSRLSFPIIQLPLEVTRPDGWLLKNRLMWFGAGLAFAFNMMNGLHVLNPILPAPGGTPYEPQYNIVTYLNTRPWSAMGWTPVNVMPFAIGLGFLIPLDLSFSLWFFYLFWKAEKVLNMALGYDAIPKAPFVEEQMLSGFLTFCGITVWMSRAHLQRVFQIAFGIGRRALENEDEGDANEPMSYRAAVFGFLFAFGALTGFAMKIGMTWWVALVFFAVYYAIITSVARLRAELGSPVHDLHWSGPDLEIVQLVGSANLGRPTMMALSMMYSINRAFRGCQMPHQLEAFKLSRESGLDPKWMLRALFVAIVVGFTCSWWTLLYCSYAHHGITGFGNEAWSRLATWINEPKGPDVRRWDALGFGGLVAAFLTVMRYRFAWWPFHPAGFAVSGNWSMNLFWVSIFLAWFVKMALFRYQGINSYRRALPFFFGLIIGDFSGGSFWAIYGVVKQVTTYNFLP